MLGLTAFLNGRAKTLRKYRSQKFLRKILTIQDYKVIQTQKISQYHKFTKEREREKLCNITFFGVQGDGLTIHGWYTHTHDRPLLPVYVIGK